MPAAFATSNFLIGWGIGAPVLGLLSDRLASRRVPILLGGLACFAPVLTLVYLPGLPQWAVYPLLLLSGIGGSASVTGFAVTREIVRPEVVATAMALVNIVPIILSSALQPFIGWLLDLQWTGVLVDGARHYEVAAFRIAFIPLIVLAVATIVAALAIREPKRASFNPPARPLSRARWTPSKKHKKEPPA